MTRLVWDLDEQRQYLHGVDRGIFYPSNGPAEVWNGLTSVQESTSSDDIRVRYVDGVKVQTSKRPDDFSGVIEAFSYPDSFYDKVLSQRRRRGFGLSYRVMTKTLYEIHIVYNLVVSPTDHLYEQKDTVPFSCNFTTTPVVVPEVMPAAHFVIDASVVYPNALVEFEKVIYGSPDFDARLPTITEILDLFEQNAVLRIVDNGDGTWTAIGPDSMISMLDPITFQIDAPSAVYIDGNTYSLKSW